MAKILIVDDSRFSQRITSTMIHNHLDDVAFSFAEDGEEGLEKFQEERPDYTIVDLLMPKLRGQDLIEKIKEIDRAARIIVLSADIQKSVRKVVELMGVQAYINKPLNDEKAKQISGIIRNDV
ncbi:response regulator transcription factor [Sporolactobacillus sp. THM19-2]|jgi:CheY-like chemotaxis protein|uniref:response regulator transcription factor n=1 Tax=Sporolactobacillus sp. THM19-2 TaxID=2511171 RepID=UPI001021ADA5|nr:response regulator [Sporolactobacillus sp. THM19-2]RYL92380.1 response regulator [Sporolactobacillus sp. THM19-2]